MQKKFQTNQGIRELISQSMLSVWTYTIRGKKKCYETDWTDLETNL